MFHKLASWRVRSSHNGFCFRMGSYSARKAAVFKGIGLGLVFETGEAAVWGPKTKLNRQLRGLTGS